METLPVLDLDLGDLCLRTLTFQDQDAALLAALLIEATQAELAPALWGPGPPGPTRLRRRGQPCRPGTRTTATGSRSGCWTARGCRRPWPHAGLGRPAHQER